MQFVLLKRTVAIAASLFISPYRYTFDFIYNTHACTRTLASISGVSHIHRRDRDGARCVFDPERARCSNFCFDGSMLTHPRVLLAEEGLPLELAKLVKASYPDNITCQVCQALDNITCQVTCQALDVVNGIDGLEFAISPDYGVVTSCPTNLGTGMRASLHIALPGLTADGTDAKAKAIAKPLGLSVRGLGGEHTPIGADGTVDISPSARFCIKESEIITALYLGISSLKAAEDEALAARAGRD